MSPTKKMKMTKWLLKFQLFDVEGQKKLQHFREFASSLHHWMKEQIVIMQVSHTFKDTTIEQRILDTYAGKQLSYAAADV
jgi:hypothetical protein